MSPERGRVLITGAVLLGATLSFGMEPLVGRLLMPGFGASVHVWLTCLVAFQGLLFAGYAYAHLLAPRIGPGHLAVLAVPLLVWPLAVSSAPAEDPSVSSVLWTLVRSAGPGFVVLCTTAVVAQSWWARSELARQREPYVLYAVSNVGSLVALLGYPILVEPWLSLTVQRWLWSIGYLAYAALMAASWLALRPSSPAPSGERAGVPTSKIVFWVAASALPAAFLVATTNLIASELGSVPLVWVLPLAIYLGSFIFTFRESGGFPARISLLIPELVIAGAFLFTLPVLAWTEAGLFVVVLAGLCWLAHGALYDRRPEPSGLTGFYLWIALGGWLGGVFSTLLAPILFDGVFEYPILLVALGGLALSARPKVGRRTPSWLLLVRVTVMIGFGGVLLLRTLHTLRQPPIAKHRSLYGTYRVRDLPPTKEAPEGVRVLVHGATIHGAEVLGTQTATRARSVYYFYEGGGIAQAYDAVPSPRRMGVLGLGVGAVAAYARPGDSIDFLEIDPDNEQLAREYFSYLSSSRADISVQIGDGRLLLARTSTTYDLMHMDAFSGDGIPVHLLTVEAIEIYLKHLAPDGLLLFHISSRSHELRPILSAAADSLDLFGAFNRPSTAEALGELEKPSQCVVLARTRARLDPLLDRGWVSFGPADGLEKVAPWTDERINIFDTLRFGRR